MPGGDPVGTVASLTAVLHMNVGITLERAEADSIIQGIREGFFAIGRASQDGSLRQCLEDAAAACAMDFEVGELHQGDKPYDERAVADMRSFVEAVGEAIATKVGSLSAA